MSLQSEMTTTDQQKPFRLPANNNNNNNNRIAAAASDSHSCDESGYESDECKVSRLALLRVLQGVSVATKTSDEDMKPVVDFFSFHRFQSCSPHLDLNPNSHDYHNYNNIATAFSLLDWVEAIKVVFPKDEEDLRQLAFLALGVSFLRQKSRQTDGTGTTTADLTSVWGLICGVLNSALLTRPLCNTSRSAQGFLAVPLCSLLKDGNIDELFRLHVWLPDGQRGNPELAIHSHQPFGQSWILAGEGVDYSYRVEPALALEVATHAEYAIAWNDSKTHDSTYKTHQTSSIVKNTHTFVCVEPADSATHTRNMSYSIPAAKYHRTLVRPDRFHASLFYFDSQRGFVKDARVLGPKNAESFIQLRDSSGMMVAELASVVDTVRSWEMFMEQGQQHASRSEWEHALRAFNSALHLCESMENFPDVIRCKCLALGQLGCTNRRFGRYEQAKDILETALADMEPCLQRVEMSGELGVVYRHMNRLVDAKRALKLQYDTAKQLKFERAICRSIGNLGMVNYQLFQRSHDYALLELAIKQLSERIQRAQRLRESADKQETIPNEKRTLFNFGAVWESIGLSRLSLCYSARGNTQEAICVALKALDLIKGSKDPIVVAMSRYFYGRALLLDGQHEEALKQFNPPRTCTPAIAFCKEPSEEHRQYLQELVEAGADMDFIDADGYTALDYAVFNGDTATEKVVLEGLSRKLDGDVERKLVQRQTEAKLRKGYRVLFQERLRPVLLGRGSGNAILQKLRLVYADALAADGDLKKSFDGLRVVQYSDFLRFGKLPRSSDGLAKLFVSECHGGHLGNTVGFVIFFSYRWIGKDFGISSPDDTENTQYRRMIDATEKFLVHNPTVDRERLSIWVVSQG